jgi:hypothetical protein
VKCYRFLLVACFEPENGDSALLRNVGNFYPSTCRYIPGDNAVDSHCCENSRSNMVEKLTAVGHCFHRRFATDANVMLEQ